MENSGNHYKCRAYFLVCPFHKNRKKKKILADSKARQKLKEMGFEISLASDFMKLAEEIQNYDFREYASLLIFAEFTCFHYKTDIDYPLEPIYKAIQRNDTLKYVTKLAMCFSSLQATVEWTQKNDVFNESDETSSDDNDKLPLDLYIPFYDLMKPECSTYSPIVIKPDIRTTIYVKPKNNDDNEMDFSSTDTFLDILKNWKPGTEINLHMHPSKENFIDELQISEQENTPNIDNFTFIQCLQTEFSTTRTFVSMIYNYLINYAYEKPVQEIAQLFCSDICSERYSDQAYYNTTCAGEGYVFHMNPALNFILNHITFPQHDARKESEKDIPTVLKTYMKKKIRTYTLIDGSLEDIQALMLKMRTTDFTWLKYLYIFISSHGDIGDIVHTKTGTYNIYDLIVKNLVVNPTLKNVQKFIIVNACRGDIDLRYDNVSEEELVKLIKKYNDQEKLKYIHDERLMIFYSTQKGFVSYLLEGGAIFLQKFCEVFEENFDETSMEAIAQKVIEKVNEYFYYQNLQIPEFCPSANSDYPIKMEFVNAISNHKAMKNMARFFKNKLKQNPKILEVLKSRTVGLQ